MKLYEEKAACCGCGACADACAAGAIRMVQDREGFFYPEIQESLCANCGRCQEVCPIRDPGPDTESRACYGAQAKDSAVRNASSSGGLFPVLARYVLDRRGSVCGAAYGEGMEVVHKSVREPASLDAIKRTKYVQSRMEGMYREIGERLEAGEWVLFCGTPCQARALQLFLGRPCARLVLVDLVCYGAPSPGLWRSYVEELERRHGGTMTDFSFRDKRNRDNGHSFSYVISGTEYAGSLYRDPYCRMYFQNLAIRPACHSCPFCKTERSSDFTIGDFWGVERVRPEADDGMGTSLAILHTEKAEEIWEEVKGELFWFSCEREDLLQPRLTGPTPAAEGRTRFMERYASPFSSLVELTFQPPQPPEKSPPQIEPPEESPQIEPPEEPSPQIGPPEEASPQIEPPEEPPQIEPPEEPPEEAPPQIEPPPEARPEPPEEPPARRTGGADRMTLLGRIKRRQFLFEELVKRDFRKKYTNNLLGVAWSILSPMLSMLVMRLVFTQFFGRTTAYYTTYLFCGNLLFSFFTESTSAGMFSIAGNANIFGQAGVPKYLFLLARSVQVLINFTLTLCVFLLFCALDGISFSPRLFALLCPIAYLLVFSLGISLLLSVAYIFFRDIRYIWTVFCQLLLYASAIFYRIDGYSPQVQRLYLLNPVYLAIRYFRDVVIDAAVPSAPFHLLMLAYAAAALAAGALVYRRHGDQLAYYV